MLHIYRDGQHIETVSDEIEMLRYIHRKHGYSIEWAAKYEGYTFLNSDMQSVVLV